MSFIDKYNQPIGIFLVLAILAGGGGIIWKNQISNIKNQKLQINNQAQNETPQTPTPKPVSSKININTASQTELESLPGIGEVKAKAIINYRQKYGKFKNKRDIIKVKGIGEKTFEKIESKIEI